MSAAARADQPAAPWTRRASAKGLGSATRLSRRRGTPATSLSGAPWSPARQAASRPFSAVARSTARPAATDAERDREPPDALASTLAAIPASGRDAFGRDWAGLRPAPPYRAARVTGALFHTQGGLETDGEGRVRGGDGAPFANLFAAGGAACGVSGAADAGYLSGNGLLAAVVLGRAAGAAAW